MANEAISSEEKSWRENLKQAVLNQDVDMFHDVFSRLPNGKALLKQDQYFLNYLMRTALEFDNDRMLDALLDQQAIGKSLLYASSDGSLKRVKKILEKIESLKQENPLQTYLGPNEYNNKNRYKTPLMIALETKNYDVAEYFIEKGYHKIDLFEDVELSKAGSKKTAQELEEEDSENTCMLVRWFNPFRFIGDNFEPLVREKEDDKEEKRVHLRIESYRACANPFYISYKFIHDKNYDAISNPLYYLLDLRQKLQKQAWMDDEFKEEYEALSNQCEDFVEELMNQCRSISEKKILTNVLPDIKKQKLEKYIIVHRREARDLSFLNLAIKANCDTLIVHPFNQLQLNSVVYPNMATWRKRSISSVLFFTLRHFILLPFLAMVVIFTTCEHGIIRYLENPMVKFMSHFWSMLSFITLIIASSFQDKFDEKLVELSIPEWMILVWLIGFIAQALVELSTQGIRRYFGQWWNWVMVAMVVFFVASYVLRFIACGIKSNWDGFNLITDVSSSGWYKLVLLASSLFSIAMVLSFVRLSMVFQVNDMLGPLQFSLYRLILDVLKFMLFFSIFFIAFGLSLRKLYSHYITTQKYIAKRMHNGTDAETDHALSSYNSGTYGLFWSIFGYTDLQTFETKDPNFTVTRETGVFLFGLFQVLAVIVAVNMLIAMMTRSFEKITDSATRKWKVSRTRIWMFWIEKGSTLPPPFNLLNIFTNLFKKIKKKISKPSRSTITKNFDSEMACVSTRESNKEKYESEREKVRVMLRRYIEKARNTTESTDELSHNIQLETKTNDNDGSQHATVRSTSTLGSSHTGIVNYTNTSFTAL